MDTKRFALMAAVATVAVAAGLAAGHWTRDAPVALESDAQAAPAPAPANAVDQLFAAKLAALDGKPTTLAALKGHPVVVNFWASWCGPCVQEMPQLVTLYHAYAKKGVRFVGVAVDSQQNVQTFLQKVRVDYPVVVSGYAGADLARNFGNTAGALPFTVVIDATGKVRDTKLGQVQPDALRRVLDAL